MIRTTATATIDFSGSCSQVRRATPAPTISVRGLRKTFGSLIAVDDLDLTIRFGEMVASLDPNSAGKSTTLDMVLGLTLPDVRTIELPGISPDHAVQADRVDVVFQDGGPLDDFTVRETLQVVASIGPRHYDNISHASRLDNVVDQASLGKLLIRKVSRCSRGKRQCLRLALALLPDPDLLVMDEPTAGMDVNAWIAFWETVHTQTRCGRIVLFATHYLEEAASFADCIVVIAHNRLVADSSVDEVRALGEGALIVAIWPEPSEESLGQHLADYPVADGIGHVAVHDEHVELCATDSDAVARWLSNATPAKYLGIGVVSFNEAFAALTPDSSDKIVPQRPEPRPSI